MERGEESIFLCAPQYAYGVAGNPAKIPHNSAVVFEVGAPGQQFWFHMSLSVTHFFSVLTHFIQFTVYLCTKIGDIYNIHATRSKKSDELQFMERIGAWKIRGFVNCLLVAIISLSFVLFAEIMWRLLLVLFGLLSFPPPTPTPSCAEFGFYLVLYNCLRHSAWLHFSTKTDQAAQLWRRSPNHWQRRPSKNKGERGRFLQSQWGSKCSR